MDKEELTQKDIPHTNIEKPSANFNKIILILLIFLTLLSSCAAAYFAYQNFQLRQKRFHLSQSTPALIPTPALTPIQKASQTADIRQSPLVFIKEGQIFLLKGLDSEPLLIDEGSALSLSNDQTKIAYVKMDKDNNIYIYNKSTKEKKTIITSEERLRAVEWSPNDRYLITDSGTGTAGRGAIYEYPSGKKISTFSILVDRLQWLNNNEFIYVEAQEVSPLRPFGFGFGSGLAKISLPSGSKKILAQANTLNDYSLLKVENEKIYFSKRTVDDNDMWKIHDQIVKTYWKMSADGAEKNEISEPETLEDEILSLIPQEYSDYRLSSLDRNNNLTNWIVFRLNSGDSISESLICIINTEDPQNTFEQIAVGTHPNW